MRIIMKRFFNIILDKFENDAGEIVMGCGVVLLFLFLFALFFGLLMNVYIDIFTSDECVEEVQDQE